MYSSIFLRKLFFMLIGWGDPKNLIFSPCNATFTRVTPPKFSSETNFPPGTWFFFFYWRTPLKHGGASFGLFLISNSAGFVVKTWQPWILLAQHPIWFFQKEDNVKTVLPQLGTAKLLVVFGAVIIVCFLHRPVFYTTCVSLSTAKQAAM